MVDSIEFAKYIIKKANELEIQINLTKLQKILYICDGTLLALGENFINEQAKAWDYGPVYPKVYKWYQKHGKEDVTHWIISKEIENNDSVKNVVFQALEKFGNWSPVQLSEWTHKEGSPWSLTMKENNQKLNSVISKEYMKLYFTGLIGV